MYANSRGFECQGFLQEEIIIPWQKTNKPTAHTILLTMWKLADRQSLWHLTKEQQLATHPHFGHLNERWPWATSTTTTTSNPRDPQRSSGWDPQLTFQYARQTIPFNTIYEWRFATSDSLGSVENKCVQVLAGINRILWVPADNWIQHHHLGI